MNILRFKKENRKYNLLMRINCTHTTHQQKFVIARNNPDLKF